jgi:methylamine dehydrogenase accessory protein MauD
VTEALWISNLVLWALVLALALVVAALARQLGVLHERLAPVGALATARGPAVGEPAPVLLAASLAGGALPIGGPAPAPTLLFFLSPTCPVCETLLPTLLRVAAEESPRVRLVLASDGEPAEHRAFVRARGLDPGAYVVSAELGLRFEVAKLPYAVLLDEAGVVRAKGLVNTREHLESLFEAWAQGVGSIQELRARERSEAPFARPEVAS